MPTVSVKIKAFEFITEKLLEWHASQNNNQQNDFSKLKLFKLLFFVSAVNASKDNDGLLDLFTSFCAMPYGPVESDVYNNFQDCKRVNISKEFTTLIDPIDENYYESIEEYKVKICNSIESLKIANNKLINYSAYDLVELSHQWISWKSIFNLARLQNKLSLPIPSSIIKFEPKILKLTINEFV